MLRRWVMRYKKALAFMVGIGTLVAGSAFAKKRYGWTDGSSS